MQHRKVFGILSQPAAAMRRPRPERVSSRLL